MKTEYFDKPVVYAAKPLSDKERMASQSGGAFVAISDVILEKGGVVYGCIFSERFEAIHARADYSTYRDQMQYSKYVQSNLLETFHSVINDLLEKRLFFSGTSCQVAGLQEFVRQRIGESDLPYCVDIVCHGVPSPLIWRDCLAWEEAKASSEISDIICRNKKLYGWKSHVTTIQLQNKRQVSSRVFPKIFYGHNALRPSCYNCPYKGILHLADLTIADYWGD